MSLTLVVFIAGAAAVAGAAGWLSAYHQLSHSYAAPVARRRALTAVPGPLVFYGVLGLLLKMGAPLVFSR
jgi:hypothetical protein